MIRPALVALVASACGDPVDPCAGRPNACIALEVDAIADLRIDHLELDLLYGDRHATTTLEPDGGGTTGFPVVFAVELELPVETHVGIVAAGKLSGSVLATGAASTTIAPEARESLSLFLAPPDACTAGGLYCGGDKLAGDPRTLYQCNGGGVPLARGRCLGECMVRPTDDDTCRGEGGTCQDGGAYCGGDKLDGDPRVLYRCAGGAGVDPQVCADGCVVRPGNDDICR